MNPSLVSRIEQANSTLIAGGEVGAIGEFFTADYVAHLTKGDRKGHAWVRRYLGMLQRAFPHLEVEVEVLLEGKDRVAWQRTLRGKHRGDFMGSPATGRLVVWRDLFTSRFRGARIAEDWVISDLAERLLLARKRATKR